MFDDRDEAQPASVILINETAARRYWPGGDAVGKRVKFGVNPERAPWITIVGVVGDIRHSNLEADPVPEIYRPYAHNPLGSPILVIRTAADAAQMIQPMRAKIRSLSAEVPVFNAYVMESLVDRSVAQRRFVMWLLTGFAISALLLAGVGVYGTVSQSVTQRTREIGLRAAVNLSAGTPTGGDWDWYRNARSSRADAPDVEDAVRSASLDPVAFGAAAAVLAGFAALACYLPARRGTRVDPLTTLRDD